MQNILLIEDQIEFHGLVRALLGHRFHVTAAANAAEALRRAESGKIDLVLLDVSLPDQDGFQLFAQLRALPGMNRVPIIFLTGRAQINDRVAAFALGAEDYIVKPFEPLEFRARVEAKLLAQASRETEARTIRKGGLLLEQERYRASVVDAKGDARDLGLTPHEYRLLQYFVQHEGHILARDQLMTAIWGTDVHVLERTIDRHVSALRRKLGDQNGGVESVHGVGYRFTVARERKSTAA